MEEIIKPEEKEENPKIQILITYYPVEKRVDVQGPLQDRGLCYMMLDLAHEAIYELKNQKPIIQKNGIINFMRGRR